MPQAQAGKQLTTTQANQMITAAKRIQAMCHLPICHGKGLDVSYDAPSAPVNVRSALPSSSPPQVPYRRRQPWSNWSRTANCTPAFTFAPRSLEELQQIVAFAGTTGQTLRVAASGHSWSTLVPTKDVLVSIRRLNRVAMDLSDQANPRVVVESGATVQEVNDVLEQHGYALPLNVVLESVRYGGLIATGSHGSGWHNPTLSDLVSTIEIVTASGELRRFEAGVDGDDVMNAARLNLGLFGVIYRITLQVQPSWHVRAIDRRLRIEEVLDRLPEWAPAHDNLDLFWWPFCDEFWVKTWDWADANAKTTAKPRTSAKDRFTDGIGVRVLRECVRLASTIPRLTPALSRAVFTATPSQRDNTVDIVEAIHYRRGIEVAKLGCVEVAFKLDPAFEHAKWAIKTVLDLTRVYAARGEYPMNVTMNVRFLHNSSCWLSPAFGEGHTCYIEILSGLQAPGWERFSGEVAQQWLTLPHARPHWAKQFQHIPGVIEHLRREMSTNIKQFNAIKAALQVDPDGMFVNEALKELF
jgi:hypothetical protein